MAKRPNKSAPSPAATASPFTTAAAPATPGLDPAFVKRVVDATNASGFTYVTAAEAKPYVAADLIEVNADTPNEDGLIPARAKPSATAFLNGGQAAGAAQAPAAAGSASRTVTAGQTFDIDTDVEIPAIKRGGGLNTASVYPFASLTTVGMSFHVKKTDDMPDPMKTLSSSVSNYNNKFATPVKDFGGNTVKETVKVNEAQRDANGNVITGPDGKRVMIGKEVTRDKLDYSQFYVVRRVGADDKRGEGARVFRTK